MRAAICLLVLLFAAAPADAAEQRCAFVVREGTRETLVNRCATCREVKVQRDRPGDGFPTTRTFTVREGTETTLPFRGSGATRILSDQACGADAAERPLTAPACIKLVPHTKIGPVLANECDDCRSANIESRERDGRRITRIYAIAGKSVIPFNNPNALDARILSQSVCKPGG